MANLKKTKDGKVDARTKEGKAIIERMKKAREAKEKKNKNSLLTKLKKLIGK